MADPNGVAAWQYQRGCRADEEENGIGGVFKLARKSGGGKSSGGGIKSDIGETIAVAGGGVGGNGVRPKVAAWRAAKAVAAIRCGGSGAIWHLMYRWYQ